MTRALSKVPAHRIYVLFQLSLKRFHLSPPPRSAAPGLWGQALEGSRAPPIASRTIPAAGPAQRVSRGRNVWVADAPCWCSLCALWEHVRARAPRGSAVFPPRTPRPRAQLPAASSRRPRPCAHRPAACCAGLPLLRTNASASFLGSSWGRGICGGMALCKSKNNTARTVSTGVWKRDGIRSGRGGAASEWQHCPLVAGAAGPERAQAGCEPGFFTAQPPGSPP